MKLLYESYDALTQRATYIERDAETGLPVIVRTQNTAPIVEANKRLAASYDKHARHPTIRHVARVPGVVWAQWSRLGITRDEKALNAVLEMRECRAFRVDDGGRI